MADSRGRIAVTAMPAGPPPLELVDRAACRDSDPDVFFPSAGQDAIAKAVCRLCPVRTACLDYALAAPALSGVWGGTTQTDRHRMIRRRARGGRRG